MKTKIIAGFVILFLVGLGVGYGVSYALGAGPTPGPAKKGLTGTQDVGAVLPFSGGLSAYGKGTRACLKIAQEDINTYLDNIHAGWDLNFVFKDSKTKSDVTKSKFEALHGTGTDIIIGPMSSETTGAVRTYCNSKKIFYCSPSSTARALAIEDDYLFRFCAIDFFQCPAIAEMMYDKGARYVSNIYLDNTWGRGLAEGAMRFFVKKEGAHQIKGNDSDVAWPTGTTDFSSYVETVKNQVTYAHEKKGVPYSKIGVLSTSYGKVKEIMDVATGYDVLKKVEWFGTDGTVLYAPLVNHDKYPDVTEFADTVNYTNTMFYIPSDAPRYQYLKAKVKDRLGREPTIYGFDAYDAAWVIALTMEKLDEYNPTAMKNNFIDMAAYYNEHFKTASGDTRLNAAGDRKVADYGIWQTGKWKGEYQWRMVGHYYGDTKTIEWKEGFGV